MFDTIATLFPKGRRRTAAAQARLAAAYTRVFSGTGDREDAEIVLVDLARHSGYYHTTPPSVASDRDIWHQEGKRALYARIARFLHLPNEARDRLASAVLMEDAATQQEKNEL